MMKYLTLLFIFFLSCNNIDSDTDPDPQPMSPHQFIIGFTYGECLGDCSHLYMLENEAVYPDTEEGYWSIKGLSDISKSLPTFSNEALETPGVVIRMQGLDNEIPDFLFDSQEYSFGCPDCADGGAIHVIQITEDTSRYWIIDNDIKNNPVKIRRWAQKVQNLLEELSF